MNESNQAGSEEFGGWLNQANSDRSFKNVIITRFAYFCPIPTPNSVQVYPNSKRFVAYYRVSTQRRGNSGLGISAQRTSVQTFIQNQGGIIAEYTDVESGKKDNRPELIRAIAYCEEKGAVLLIAKLPNSTGSPGTWHLFLP